MPLDHTAQGLFPIAPTPFHGDGRIDMGSIDGLVDFYRDCGSTGLTVLGVMGEAPKLEGAEALEVARRFVRRAAGLPVIVGVSAPGFAAMRSLALASMDAGAAGVMVAPPNTLRTDDQIVTYYRQAAEAMGPGVPFVIQDYPLNFTVVMTPGVIRRIVQENPACVMLKHEDWPGLEKISQLRGFQADGSMRPISILCGNGGLFLDFETERGADGAMTGYAFPDMLADVVRLAAAKQRDAAHDLFDAHLPLLRYEQQPGIGLAVRKYVMARRGMIASDAQRAPGPGLSAAAKAEVEYLLARVARHDARAGTLPGMRRPGRADRGAQTGGGHQRRSAIVTGAKSQEPCLPGNIWIDVEDLFEYAKANPRPSGIQRLAFEIYSAMQDRYGESGRIRFVRHDPVRQSFRAVPWAAVASLFERLTQAGEPGPASPARPAGGIRPDPALRLMLRRLSHRLPPGLRSPLTRFVRLQAEAARAALEALGALARGIRRRLLGRWGSASVPLDADGPQESGGFAQTVAPGDAILVLGSPWFHPGYDAIIARHRAQYGVRFAMLVYDIIPLRRPEWCDRGLVRIFGAWFPSVLPLTDVVFAISRATALDVERYARDIGVRLNAPPQVLPIGTGFRAPPLAPGAAPAAPTSRMPPAGSYALIVSTIEARKNHVLLFRVWRRMVDEMPADAIPTLVFAGRVGWLIDDLMRQLDNTDFLGGKVLLIEDPSDAELEVLYRGCLFTLFPSLYEGWGLPVTESLAFGKPCLISDRTSLPEAGGTLARYFDPDNITEAYALIRATIEDRDGLRSWEATIARDFRPVPWAATVDGILDGMGITMPERAGPSAG